MIDMGIVITCAGFTILLGLGLELYYNKIKTLTVSHDKIQIDFKLLHNKVDKIEKLINHDDQDHDQDHEHIQEYSQQEQ